MLIKKMQSLPATFRGFFVVGVAVLSVSLKALACSCRYTQEFGFIHSVDQRQPLARLPANARGVLFLSDVRYESIVYLGGTGSYLVKRPFSSPVTAELFSMFEDGRDVPISVSVRWLDVDSQLQSSGENTFYVFKDAFEQRCLEKPDDRKCASSALQAAQGISIEQLRARRKVVDVTDEVRRTTGLFRIEPQGGFQQGKTYVIKYLGSPERTMTVSIDAALPAIKAADFALERDGNPRGTLINVPAGGSCAESAAVIAQYLAFKVPAAYERYRGSMLFFTQTRSRASVRTSESQQFKASPYVPALCSQIPFGGSLVGPGKEMVFASCSTQDPAAQSIQARGFAGMLEVEDKLHETALLDIDLAPQAGMVCNGFSFLQHAEQMNDTEQIRQQICLLPQGYARASDIPENFVSVVSKFARHADPGIRHCAVNAMTSVLQSPLKQDVSTVRNVVDVLTAALLAADAQERQSIVYSIWNAASEINRNAVAHETPSGVDMSLLKPMLPSLIDAVVSTQDSDRQTKGYALEILKMMGPAAWDVVPALLANGSIGYQDVDVLVAIAPEDPRVLERLRTLANGGDIHAMRAYAALLMRTDKRKAVAVLLKAAQPENIDAYETDAIDAIGEMGTDARMAAPALHRIANTANEKYRRQAALNALAHIGESNQKILATILVAVKHHPERVHESWEVLRMMGVRARSAAPVFAEALQALPVDGDYVFLVSILREIGASKKTLFQLLRKAEDAESANVRREAKEMMAEIGFGVEKK